jgi:hypothetical protein
VWGVGCGVWGKGRINKNNLLTPADRRKWSILFGSLEKLLFLNKIT